MRRQYEKYYEAFQKNDFLRRHDECIPFIGEKYEESRLLLIGESHYVPKVDVICVNREDFYEISFYDLAEGFGGYKGWINTREVFEKRVYEKIDFKNFFSNAATEIARALLHTDILSQEQKVEAMHQYAFMNYFKRPSYNSGKTIEELSEKDYQYAYNVSCHIIDVLKPRLTVFLSQKAYWAFCDSDRDNIYRNKYDIKSVSHPSSCWWNRKRRDGKCAREDFYGYISELYK